MNEKKLQKVLSKYTVDQNTNGKKKTIDVGKQMINDYQKKRHSWVDLLISTLRFIPIKTFLLQLILVFLTVGIIIFHATNQSALNVVVNSYWVLMMFSVVFFMDDLYQSYTQGVWELEQTFKYDLRQHTLMKLLVFGLFDFGIIFLIAAFSQVYLAVSLFKILLFLIVPYNVTCILLLSVLTWWRKGLSSYLLWGISGLVAMLFLVIANITNILSMATGYWLVAAMLTTCIMVLIIYQQFFVETT